MTVKELHKELSLLIEEGHADTRVIANCNFKVNDVKFGDFYVCHLTDVYYQSGDIELNFTNEVEE